MRVSKKKSYAIQAVAFVSLVLLAVLPAAGADRAAMSVLGGEIAWAQQGSSDRSELRVSGPEVQFLQRFDAGEIAVFSLVDAEGEALADGTYVWQLRAQMAPVNDGVYDPANGRNGASAERRSPTVAPAWVDWGAFTIENGAVLDPNVDEARQPKADG